MGGALPPLDLNHIYTGRFGRYDFYVGLVGIAANPIPKHTLMCGICIADRKLSENSKKLKPLQPAAAKLRQEIREHSSLLAAARRLVPRFRSGGAAAESPED